MEGLPAAFDASHAGAIEGILAATQIPDQTVQDTARQQLEACENVPGYVSLLLVRLGGTFNSCARGHAVAIVVVYAQSIVENGRVKPSVDSGMLSLAVICARNSVKRHWTSRGAHSTVVPEAERPSIRATAVRLVGVVGGSPGAQLCQLVANIARLDWPRVWPDLFPTIVANFQSTAATIMTPGAAGDALVAAVDLCCRWLKLMNEVVRELSSICLPLPRKTFREGAVAMMRALMPMHVQLMDQVCLHVLVGCWSPTTSVLLFWTSIRCSGALIRWYLGRSSRCSQSSHSFVILIIYYFRFTGTGVMSRLP